MKFTVAFLIFAYLVGGMYAIVTGEAMPEQGFTVGSDENIGEAPSYLKEAENIPVAGFFAKIISSLWEFLDALYKFAKMLLTSVNYVLSVLAWSFKPLAWDLGWEPLNILSKGIWTILLAAAYMDISKDVIRIIGKMIEAIGSLIPIT
jgi:uncharacterized membrane protein YvlD (DUF360 family)